MLLRPLVKISFLCFSFLFEQDTIRLETANLKNLPFPFVTQSEKIKRKSDFLSAEKQNWSAFMIKIQLSGGQSIGIIQRKIGKIRRNRRQSGR